MLKGIFDKKTPKHVKYFRFGKHETRDDAMKNKALLIMCCLGMSVAACDSEGLQAAGEDLTQATGTPGSQQQDGTADDRCNEETITGYWWLSTLACPIQATVTIEDLTSKQGYVCGFDVLASDESPEDVRTTTCDAAAPMTSACFLERIGLIDEVGDELPWNVEISLSGYYDTLSVCGRENCQSKDDSCSVCRPTKVFVPCSFDKR